LKTLEAEKTVEEKRYSVRRLIRVFEMMEER
jgi:hypothetical protein